jgi:hypothetical protein
MSVFQDLYHSEINFSVSTFWDGGFDVRLGDEMSGFKASATIDRWGQIEPWLTAEAIKAFPKSIFALMYRDGLHVWLDHQGRAE